MARSKGNKEPDVLYPPELMTPHVRIKPPLSYGLLGIAKSDEEKLEIEREYALKDTEALRAKLRRLAEFYKAIEGDDIKWRTLAISLALAHVDGFQIVEALPKRRGRPRKSWSAYSLYRDVLAILDGGEASVANACRILSKRKGQQWYGKKAETLEARFHDMKRNLQKAEVGYSRSGLFAEFIDELSSPSPKYPRPFGGLFELGALAIGGALPSDKK